MAGCRRCRSVPSGGGAELRPPRLIAGHFFDNPASRRVLEKAGFRPTGASEEAFSMARGRKALSIDLVLELDPAECLA